MNDSSPAVQIRPFLPETVGRVLDKAGLWDSLEEIRFRINRPVQLICTYKECFLTESVISREMLNITFQKISGYSAYACREELKEGFITLPGGHRAGLCGRVYADSEGCRQIRDITSMNIRVARQMPGCCRSVLNLLVENELFPDTMIISPPGFGKTTLLRDLIRHLSDGFGSFPGKRVSVVDERGEIADVTREGESFYLGKRTDVLDRCPKAEGMLLMVRSMNPEVIAVDEIGSREDIEAMKVIRNSGCSLLITVHGRDPEEISGKPGLGSYLKDHPFNRYLVIKKKKGGERMTVVYDEKGRIL